MRWLTVKYHGFSGLQEFICIRPGRFGRKLWADCGTSGHCFKFNFCCGKSPKNNEGSDLLLWSEVVWNTLEYNRHPYSYYVYIDNVLKSRDLMVYIGLLGYYAVGIWRENPYTLHQRSHEESLRNLWLPLLVQKWFLFNGITTVFLLALTLEWLKLSWQFGVGIEQLIRKYGTSVPRLQFPDRSGWSLYISWEVCNWHVRKKVRLGRVTYAIEVTLVHDLLCCWLVHVTHASDLLSCRHATTEFYLELGTLCIPYCDHQC